MFEESQSFRPLKPASSDRGQELAHPAQMRRGETALKAIAWSDLTARLEAARDLRQALRHEARRNIEDTAASFSDAAAQYFRKLEDSQRPVNLGALNEHKGSTPIVPGQGGYAAGTTAVAHSGRDDAKEEQ
jgi:hypothetical protein